MPSWFNFGAMFDLLLGQHESVGVNGTKTRDELRKKKEKRKQKKKHSKKFRR